MRSSSSAHHDADRTGAESDEGEEEAASPECASERALAEGDGLRRGLFPNRGVRAQLPQLHRPLSLIHISEPTRQAEISYAVFCHHFSDPSSRWSGGTCSETSDQSSCELFSYPAGRCADQGYPHKCIGNYAIAFWYKDVDCATCTTPDTSEGVACS